ALSFFFFSSRRRHTSFSRDWSSDVCSSDLLEFSDKLSGAGIQPIAGVLLAIDFEDTQQPRNGSGPAAPAAALARRDGMIALYAKIGRASCRERGSMSGVAV